MSTHHDVVKCFSVYYRAMHSASGLARYNCYRKFWCFILHVTTALVIDVVRKPTRKLIYDGLDYSR